MKKHLTKFFMAAGVLLLAANAQAQCALTATITVTIDPSDSMSVLISGGFSNGGPGTSGYISTGDGNFISPMASNYTYSNAGTYSVCFYAIDSLAGCSASACDSVTVNAPSGGGGGGGGFFMTCNANFSTVNNGNNSYTFTNLSSSSDSNAVVYSTWYVDNSIVSYASNLNYTAPDSLMHSVCLTQIYYNAATNDTCYSTWCDSIGYGNPGGGGGGFLCQAGFVLWQDSLNPSIYYGYNTSTGGPGTTYLWSFGDGNTSTSQYPSHTYAATGIYNICLTITDSANNCTSTWCDSAGVFKMAGPGMSEINILAPTTGIQHTADNISASVFPNPLTDNSSLNIHTDKAMKVQVQIVNLMGQVVSTEQVQLNAGKNTIQLKTELLPVGVFFLNISNENKTLKNIKLVK